MTLKIPQYESEQVYCLLSRQEGWGEKKGKRRGEKRVIVRVEYDSPGGMKEEPRGGREESRRMVRGWREG